MENQHRQIKGYRELSQEEIDVMNAIKETGKVVGELFDSLEAGILANTVKADPRWLEIAKTDLQKGFMELTRAVAQPEFF
jgi:hypothetical protein